MDLVWIVAGLLVGLFVWAFLLVWALTPLVLSTIHPSPPDPKVKTPKKGGKKK